MTFLRKDECCRPTGHPARDVEQGVAAGATKSPGLFFTTRRVEKNSPGLFSHKWRTIFQQPATPAIGRRLTMAEACARSLLTTLRATGYCHFLPKDRRLEVNSRWRLKTVICRGKPSRGRRLHFSTLHAKLLHFPL